MCSSLAHQKLKLEEGLKKNKNKKQQQGLATFIPKQLPSNEGQPYHSSSPRKIEIVLIPFLKGTYVIWLSFLRSKKQYA